MVKNVKIFQLFLLGIIGQETIFDDILERKQAFLVYKNKKIKKRKSGIFSKGLVHGFGQKIENFSAFSVKYIRPGKYV